MVSFRATELTDAEIQLTAGLVSLPAESPVPCLLLDCPIVGLLYPRFIGIPVQERHTLTRQLSLCTGEVSDCQTESFWYATSQYSVCTGEVSDCQTESFWYATSQ
jgi:hypothetical protein